MHFAHDEICLVTVDVNSSAVKRETNGIKVEKIMQSHSEKEAPKGNATPYHPPTISELASTLWLTLSVDHRVDESRRKSTNNSTDKSAYQHHISLITVSEVSGTIAFGDYFPENDVDPDISGCWMEVIGHFNQVLYRRFVQDKISAPRIRHHGIEHNRSQNHVHIALPKLPQASHICLWEQTPEHFPSKRALLHIPLESEFAQAV
ncbi:hypothetical protein TDB9533_03975 [Thalassocella blandensis]|nr:hypothetical protein TDB9533_03975 [Thalassocella blandensis]